MSKIIVDTSVWIEYFSGKNPKAKVVSDLIDNNSICVNNAILAELVPIIKHKGESKLVDLMNAVTKYDVKVNWEKIIHMQITNLKHGLNSVGLVDLMIVQCVLENDLTLLTFDKHFEIMSKFFKFKLFK